MKEKNGKVRCRTNAGSSAWTARVACAGGATLLLAGGCAQSPPSTASRPPVNLSGYSAAFKEGFGAGCEAAKGTFRRDEQRYKADDQYARGWEDGRSICARR